MSISEVVELEDDGLLPPPPPPPPPLPEAAEDLPVEPEEEEEEDVVADVPPDAVFVVDALWLLFELDAVVLADVAVAVPLVPNAAAVTEEVDCICMVPGFHLEVP